MTRFLLALAAALVAVGAQAQQWPTKPVRVIVNVAPGGVADVTARVLGARLSETLAQPFVIENRPGGDGYIGFEAGARAETHGYTLGYSPGPGMMVAPHIVERPGLHPIQAIAPGVAPGGGAPPVPRTGPAREEKGIRGVEGGPLSGFYAPAGTPREALDRMNREVQRAIKEPAVLERFKALAVTLAEPMTPEQFGAYVRA